MTQDKLANFNEDLELNEFLQLIQDSELSEREKHTLDSLNSNTRSFIKEIDDEVFDAVLKGTVKFGGTQTIAGRTWESYFFEKDIQLASKINGIRGVVLAVHTGAIQYWARGNNDAPEDAKIRCYTVGDQTITGDIVYSTKPLETVPFRSVSKIKGVNVAGQGEKEEIVWVPTNEPTPGLLAYKGLTGSRGMSCIDCVRANEHFNKSSTQLKGCESTTSVIFAVYEVLVHTSPKGGLNPQPKAIWTPIEDLKGIQEDPDVDEIEKPFNVKNELGNQLPLIVNIRMTAPAAHVSIAPVPKKYCQTVHMQSMSESLKPGYVYEDSLSLKDLVKEKWRPTPVPRLPEKVSYPYIVDIVHGQKVGEDEGVILPCFRVNQPLFEYNGPTVVGFDKDVYKKVVLAFSHYINQREKWKVEVGYQTPTQLPVYAPKLAIGSNLYQDKETQNLADITKEIEETAKSQNPALTPGNDFAAKPTIEDPSQDR